MSEDPKKAPHPPGRENPNGPGQGNPQVEVDDAPGQVRKAPLEGYNPGSKKDGETQTAPQLLGRKVSLSGDQPPTPFGSFAT
jgi:hypothetical protein